MRMMRELVRDNNVYRWAGSMLLEAARMRRRRAIRKRMVR
jgi:trehalose 6-phosphate synthase